MGAATALELATQRARRAHEQILGLVEGLSDDQLARRPAPPGHSIAWTLWHLARSADKLAAELSDGRTARREIWIAEDLARAWGLPAELLGSNGVGTGIDDETAARLRPPPKDRLLDYCRRVFAAADDAVGRLRAEDLAREYESPWLERRATVGDALFTSLTHDNRHLGELEFLKGLLGMRGSVTR